MRLTAYMDHPLGDLHGIDDAVKRADNLANATEWERFLLETTHLILWAPWHVYAIAFGAQINAPRRLVDNLATLERADIYIQTGGVVSPHMHKMEKAARRIGVPTVDLTSFGVLPPDKTEEAAQMIALRIQRAIKSKPRRVWMPLLTDTDIDALIKMQHAIDMHLPDEHPLASGVISRIVTAAKDEIDG